MLARSGDERALGALSRGAHAMKSRLASLGAAETAVAALADGALPARTRAYAAVIGAATWTPAAVPAAVAALQFAMEGGAKGDADDLEKLAVCAAHMLSAGARACATTEAPEAIAAMKDGGAAAALGDALVRGSAKVRTVCGHALSYAPMGPADADALVAAGALDALSEMLAAGAGSRVVDSASNLAATLCVSPPLSSSALI